MQLINLTKRHFDYSYCAISPTYVTNGLWAILRTLTKQNKILDSVDAVQEAFGILQVSTIEEKKMQAVLTVSKPVKFAKTKVCLTTAGGKEHALVYVHEDILKFVSERTLSLFPGYGDMLYSNKEPHTILMTKGREFGIMPLRFSDEMQKELARVSNIAAKGAK